MKNPKKTLLQILVILCIALFSLTGFFIYLIKENEFETESTFEPIVAKIEETSMEFKSGEKIFKNDCNSCHRAKYQLHHFLDGIVEELGSDYLKLYITNQDSLLKAKDKYAVANKNEWGNSGFIHKFEYSESEFSFLIEYLK